LNDVPPFNDDYADHLHVQIINSSGTVVELGEAAVSVQTPAEGQVGHVWVDYCNNDLHIYIDTSSGTIKPSTPSLTVNPNITGLFALNAPFYLGHTAGTWDQGDYHDIMSWEFHEGCPQ